MPRNVSPVVINPEGIPFRARLVFKGDQYGDHRLLTHDSIVPLIEFFDARYASVRSKYCTRPSRLYEPEGSVIKWYRISEFLQTGRGGPEWAHALVRGGINPKLTDTGLELYSDSVMYLSPGNVRKFTSWAKARLKAHGALPRDLSNYLK